MEKCGKEGFMKWTTVFFALALCAASARGDGSGNRVTDASQESRLVRDLRAVRKGDNVTLTWTQPSEKENRQPSVGHLTVARICRDISSTISESASACPHPLRQVNLEKSVAAAAIAVHEKPNAETTFRVTDVLPENQDGSDHLQFAVYKLELLDDHGRSAGFSNSVAVPLAPLLPAKGLHSELDARGVYLIWEVEAESGSSLFEFDYRIYRREKGSSKRVTVPYLRAVVHTAEGERWSGVDTGIDWEKAYLYSVTPITRVYSQEGRVIAEIEGDDSAPLEVITHDIFPPAVPERLLPVVGHIPGKKFVDLLWAPNSEKDISGYVIYRREENGQPARINSVPISAISFQDVNVLAGHQYLYSISAVDVRGNEGARSLEKGAAVP
jgi:hypothetical protein